MLRTCLAIWVKPHLYEDCDDRAYTLRRGKIANKIRQEN